jgi:hypothetical protein
MTIDSGAVFISGHAKYGSTPQPAIASPLEEE